MKAYNATASTKTGTLTLKAPIITINGILDGSGAGYHIITVRSQDKAGNINDATTTIEVKKEKKTTTTTTASVSAVDLLVLLLVLVLVIVIVAQAFILRKSREMKRRRRLR